MHPGPILRSAESKLGDNPEITITLTASPRILFEPSGVVGTELNSFHSMIQR
jgi:hypothetical protein